MKKILLIVICLFITSTLSSCNAFESRFYFDSNEECFTFIEEILVYNEKYDHEFTYVDLGDEYSFIKETYWSLTSWCTHANTLDEFITCDCSTKKYDFATYKMFITLDHPYLSYIFIEHNGAPLYDKNVFSNVSLDNCYCQHRTYLDNLYQYNSHNVKVPYDYKPSSKFKDAIPEIIDYKQGVAREHYIDSINYDDQTIIEIENDTFTMYFIYKENIYVKEKLPEEYLNFEKEILEYCLNNQKTIILNPSDK